MASDGYLSFPHIQGDLLAFVADDDVWLAPVSGGRAWRLTADRVQASHPRLSPDGSLVAWTSWRDSTPEIHAAEAGGTLRRRLTYWGDARTRMRGWTPGGDVLAITASGQSFAHVTWAHEVPVAGGQPRRLPFGPVADLVIGRAAAVLLTGSMGRDPAAWKRYRGGTSGRLWVRDGGGTGQSGAGGRAAVSFTQVLTSLRGQVACPMLVAGRVVFIADHEGTGNLYSCRLDGSDLRRHTDHEGWYVRNASTDGNRVVYQCAGDVWILGNLDGEAREIPVTLGSPPAGRRPRTMSAADHLDALSCNHRGQASAIEVSGTVHWLTHRDGPARVLACRPDACARLPRVLGTGGQVAWISDAGGQDAIEIADATALQPSASVRRLAAGQLSSVAGMSAAPDGSAMAVAAHEGQLRIVDAATGTVTELASSADGPPDGLAWSPDSAWLAWSHPGPRPLRRIRLARVADGAVFDVTDGRFTDTDPVFTTDGLYLGFLSVRSFDPVYDAHFFELSFPYGCRPYLVPLAATTSSPFAPLPGGRPPVGGSGTPGKPESPQGPGAAAGDGGTSMPEERPVAVDTDGLAGRIVQVPVAESRYSSLRAVRGGLAWLRQPVTGALGEGTAEPGGEQPRAALERFDLTRRECEELLGELDWFESSGDGRFLVVGDRDEVRVLPAEHKAEPGDNGHHGGSVTVDLSRARFLADPGERWRHAYEEAGRVMRRDFWVADMAGVDWDGVLGTYRPLLSRVAGPGDFADLLWEVLGELGSSHAYVSPSDGDPRDPRSRRVGDGDAAVGLLGADLERDGDGVWRVARVLPGESSDPRARSPLAAPGAAIRPGDALLAIDGQPVDPALGPGPLLIGTAGKPVELSVSAGPPGSAGTAGEPRRVVITPLGDDRRLRYQDWVAGRRRLVRELSGGRAGYLHVPDMMGEGWAHFHRDLRLEMARDALIVDLRGNRGGHVSQLVVEKLARRVIGWDVPRGLRPQSYPQDAPRGPVIALADEFAGSDGDIVTAAIRILGLGPVVGTRTWGGVIGIDGLPGHRLVDGTAITVPRYAFWFDGYGWDVENHGVDPDVEVIISPGDWAEGRDPQLETAVRLATESLADRPLAAAPDTSRRPSRGRPALPPRQPR